MKMTLPSRELAESHYADLGQRWGGAVFASTTSFLCSGPVVAMVLEGVAAVPVVRKLIGVTIPGEAAPGTIRGDFAHQSQGYADARGQAIMNLVHASSSAEEAERELALWFDDSDASYQTANQAWVF